MSNKTTIIVSITLTFFFIYMWKTNEHNARTNKEYDRKINYLKNLIELRKKENNEKENNNTVDVDEMIRNRDNRVINDPLYPPINRMEKPLTNDYIKMYEQGVFGQTTNYNKDTYRLIAYLVNTNDKNDVWQLFGRQRQRGSSRGDFYVVSFNRSSNDNNIKLQIEDDMMTSKEKIRDIYALPKYVSFQSPLMASDSFELVELKNAINFGPYF